MLCWARNEGWILNIHGWMSFIDKLAIKEFKIFSAHCDVNLFGNFLLKNLSNSRNCEKIIIEILMHCRSGWIGWALAKVLGSFLISFSSKRCYQGFLSEKMK